MSPEQRAAAAERLAKARASKAPAKNISIHESIRDLDDDHPLSPAKVKDWIKAWKEKLAAIRYHKNSKDKKEVADYYSTQNYILNMQNYLSSGCWNDLYYGEGRSMRYVPVCVAPAYDDKGNPKFQQGVFYPKYGGIYLGDGKFTEPDEQQLV